MHAFSIQTDAEHKAALKQTSMLMENAPPLGTQDGDRLDELVTLVQRYEAGDLQGEVLRLPT